MKGADSTDKVKHNERKISNC